jgi:hypothetical protein
MMKLKSGKKRKNKENLKEKSECCYGDLLTVCRARKEREDRQKLRDADLRKLKYGGGSDEEDDDKYLKVILVTHCY